MKQMTADIKNGDRVDSTFLVAEKSVAVAKNGKPYMNLKLMDASGAIDGKVWECVKTLDAAFDVDDFVRVVGSASVYNNAVQLTVTGVVRIDEDGLDIGLYLPVAPRPLKDMVDEFDALRSELRGPLSQLMASFRHDGELLFSDYCRCPGAKGVHHAYIGGLLEHSLGVARICQMTADEYGLDLDLLTVAALLHDIGKVREYSFRRSTAMTDEGVLLGHVHMGAAMIGNICDNIVGFPEETRLLLQHMILSHHGHLEFGSPRRPKTLEAVALYLADELDSKLTGIRTLIRAEAPDGGWTSKSWQHGRKFYGGVNNTMKTNP